MPAPVTPLIAVDTMIRLADHKNKILLIQRKNPPLGWALPGGFVDLGETLEQAAVREAFEEVSLSIQLQALLGCYSAPNRDPRGHTVSAVYVASASGQPVAADDAAAFKLVDPMQPGCQLAFDHALILQDYNEYCRSGRVAPLRQPSPCKQYS